MDYAEARAAFFQPRDDGAPAAGTAAWQSPARRLRDAIEPIATISFWSEPSCDAYAGLGLDFLLGYVWSRGCVLGEPDAGVVAGAFGVFEPGLISQLWDGARAAASLDQIRAARVDGAVTALRAVLPEAKPAAVTAVLRRGAVACGTTGRALYSGLTGLPWPEDELGQLWHACTLLRELRGDAHLAACAVAGLTGLEANLLTELQVGWEPQSYTGTRGWSPEAMDAALASLREHGLAGDGGLTEAGGQLRAGLEEATDAQLVPALVAMGGQDLAQALPQLEKWSQAIVDHGWFPPDPYKRAAG